MMKSRSIWSAAAMAAVALTGCAVSQPPSGAGPASSSGEPQRGGTIHVEVALNPGNANPHSGAGRWDMAFRPAYDRLFHFRNDEVARYGDLVIDPNRGLTASWEQADDRTYIIKLRPNVKWHDGKPFTADDAVFTMNWIKDPKNRAPRAAGYILYMDKAEVVDPLTVKLTTTMPDATFLNGLEQVDIIPKHVFDAGDNLENQVVGTGPFKLVSYTKGQSVVLERNPNYFMEGRPYFDRHEAIIGLDQATQLAAFMTQRLDVHTAADHDEMQQGVQGNASAVAIPFHENFNGVLRFRIDRPPLSDVRVRQAIHLAMDRQDLLKIVTAGKGVVPPFILPHQDGRGVWSMPESMYINTPGFRQPKTADVAEAKKLMADAGYPNGFKLSVKLQKGSIFTEKAAPPLWEQLRRSLGIEVEAQFLEPAVVTKDDADGNYQAMYSGSFGSWGDPAPAFNFYYSKSAQNSTKVNDPELDRLIELQARTLDTKKRLDAIYDVQRYFAKTFYGVPVIDHEAYLLVQPWIHGIGYPHKAIPELEGLGILNIWVDQH